MKLFSKKTVLLMKLSCAKRVLRSVGGEVIGHDNILLFNKTILAAWQKLYIGANFASMEFDDMASFTPC